jgi:hypothetical protein
MSCRIDMADLFGDETIEIVDLGGKETENLDTTIECSVPSMCEDMCKKKIDEKADDESFEARETEAGYEPEEPVLSESIYPLTQEIREALQSSDARCCTQNDVTMCLPMMIQHVDQKAQAEIRKVELEELRQLSLAKQNGRFRPVT